MAGQVLFLSSGPATPLGGAALYGIESGAGGAGYGGGSVGMVERRGPLRGNTGGRVAGFGRVARAVGCEPLESVPGRRRS